MPHGVIANGQENAGKFLIIGTGENERHNCQLHNHVSVVDLAGREKHAKIVRCCQDVSVGHAQNPWSVNVIKATLAFCARHVSQLFILFFKKEEIVKGIFVWDPIFKLEVLDKSNSLSDKKRTRFCF